ncbi:hypothetical protein BDR26DRAFT_902676 [Obelidium mucronatum]|nr:hypothetical protein BDR26DRAFT_902676 [Obelidium mucronatum]
MLSGILLPSTHVIAGHLFKWSWKDSCFRNGLLLFKSFEYAFDNSHMCFEYSSFQAMMAKRFALEQRWIGEDEAGSLSSMSMWSELEQTKKDQIHAWFQGLRSAAQKQVEVIDGSGSDSDE